MSEHLFFAELEVKFAESQEADQVGVFEGYASVFNNVDRGNDICIPGCFTKTLSQSSSERLPMLWMHKIDEPIGEWLEVREDAKGLFVKGRLWLDKGIANAERAYAMLKSKQGGMSFGYNTKKKSMTKDGKRRLEELDLGEISVVVQPMNPEARVAKVKSEQPEQPEKPDSGVAALVSIASSMEAATAAAAFRRAAAAVAEKKYSPDQERDERGRFSSGGGGGGGESPRLSDKPGSGGGAFTERQAADTRSLFAAARATDENSLRVQAYHKMPSGKAFAADRLPPIGAYVIDRYGNSLQVVSANESSVVARSRQHGTINVHPTKVFKP